MIGLKKDININLLTKTKYVFLKNKSRKKKWPILKKETQQTKQYAQNIKSYG